MPNPGAGVIYYYSSKDEDGLQELEKESEVEPKLEPPIAAIPSDDYINQFLKLPRAPRRAAIQSRHDPLIDYNSSQLFRTIP